MPDTAAMITAGKPYWKAAGVDIKIDLRIGPASDTLDGLLNVSLPQLTSFQICLDQRSLYLLAALSADPCPLSPAVR